MAAVVLIVIVMNVVFWGMKPKKAKNRQSEKGLITSHRHYTKIHIETQTAATAKKESRRTAGGFHARERQFISELPLLFTFVQK